MKPIVLTVFLFVGCIVAESDFHSDLPPADLQKYFGVQVRENVPMYEVVSPVHIKGSRHRRSLLAAKEPLRYDLTAFGEDFKLHLEHNDHLIAPGCLVHFMQSNGTKKVRSCPTHKDDCYYHGASLTHNGSDVALSTCNGLHGLIRLPDRDHDLWIQPVEDRHVDRVRRSTSGGALEQPHIIYKRAVEERDCATQGMPEVNQLVSEAESLGRVRRGAGEKFAEMLLVADTTMADHYKEKLREYLLTVANVAARVLLDRSIGTPLHFTVVKIQILDVDQPGLVINEDAEDTLDSFCTWQEQHNPRDDSNPQHYDGASLFTRKDIVHNGVRDTTGYATVSGMCGEKTRCSINEDNGLGVGLTLAHETGHTLGMVHDGSGNNCDNGKNVMSSMGGGGHTAMMWSTCSRQAYTQFLGTTEAECLNDQPQSSIAMSKDLPGVVYDGDEQCEMYVGAGSTLCLGTNMVQGDECSHLVCFDPQQTGTCKGDSVPRLDGTMCGDRKYCMHGQCVDIGLNGPQPRNGAWSAWETEWSACSRKCGGGVRVRRRKCDNPKPRLGGSDCPGSSIVAEICNVQACKKSEEEFRADQCAMTDSIPVNGQRHHWVPVNMLGEQECELHCRVDGQRTVLLRHINGKGWYQDGTTCASATASFGRCVDGKCRSFGCDGKTGSQYQFDRCGVCGGQGNTCSKQSGAYNKGRKHEYVTFVTVPKGSTDVNIKNDNKFTQMSVKVAGKRLFSEDGGEADQSGTYTAEAIVVDYKSPSSGEESISISGPLPEPVEAQVWRKFDDSEFQGVAPQINFEYFVPSASQPTSNYQWTARNGACTKTCGGGVYNRIITCTRRGGGAQVDDHLCDLRQKPAMTGSACNNQACPPRWRTGQFGQCSKTCGGGQQTRAVDCVQARGGREEVVAVGSCPANSRPSATQRCNINPCPAIWVSGDWSACSLTCGKGVHTRSVQCVKDDGSRQKVADSQCPSDSKPAPTEACINAVCSPDITGDACKDTDGTCASYGLTMCQDYASFAKQSCMKHCAFCTPDGTVGAICENKNKDCEGYGNSICAGEYTEWARSNCAKLCGYCGGSVSGGGGAACEDKNDQCSGYGASVCTGDYADWAKDNCAKLCGHCGGTSTGITDNNSGTGGGGGSGGGSSTGSTASGACEDKSGDCGGYGQSVCSGQYADWAKDNCAKYCGHCTTGATGGAGAGGGSSGGSAGGTSTGAGAACQDKNEQCSGYGASVCTGDYADWAKDNCAKMCGVCGSTGTSTSNNNSGGGGGGAVAASSSTGNCVDVSADCAGYGADVCTSYADWAAANCQKSCNKCGNRRRRSVLAPPPPRPLCNNVLTDPVGSLSLIGRPVDASCSQIIVAPIGSRIQLSFTDLRISCKEGDWLEVREEGGKKKGKKMKRDLCDLPAPVQWTTTGHIVTIKLSVATPGHGYNMSYRVEKSPDVQHGCDRLLTNPSGAVASPGFPAPYRHNKLCLTTIVAPPNFTVRLNFDLFRLDSEKCGKDTVTVYDEEYGNKDVFCGTWPDLTWQSKGNRVKVVFASDQMKNGPGFLASYKFIAP
ncbi:hypothetical protein V1264_006491 [Littorina saxatilis]|uniref:Uncharacterized protein n=1 Tax=Littorina saxatilis TaxID=31220 RepID=A0AAN9G4B6_9CAEN